MKYSDRIRKLLIASMLILAVVKAQGQFASAVADYLPAPGQYTNADFIGTPSAASSIVGTNSGLVCLGAFGGSIVIQFAAGIKNDPQNPYGVDFTVFGNATGTWSEPGIIQVMKDENKNGLADDPWYEIAGSDHHWNTTTSDYEVTYQNSGLTAAVDIHWTDNQGVSGLIPKNSFHLQSYYPQPAFFPQLAVAQYFLHGTRLKGQVDLSVPGVVSSFPRAFGYADNTPVLSVNEKLPDNPYTQVIEGSGGDAIDIDWAIDKDGKPVRLDEIHFIRIYTGMNALVGWLGEVSTEISGIRDVEPAVVNGPRSRIVMQDLGPKIMQGETSNINALLFESGIRVENAPITWSVSLPDRAVIENGHLKALQVGKIQLRASSALNPAVYVEKELEIFSAGKADITLTSNSLKVNDKLKLTGRLTDQNGRILTGITPTWRVDNPSVAQVIQEDGLFYLHGKLTGNCWLYLESVEMKSLRDSVQIQVLAESVMKRVFVSIKTIDKTLVPRQSFWVETLDLTSKVNMAQKTYPLTETSFVSLAHVLAAVYKNTELEDLWAFRDDAHGGSALYLWRIPESEEGSTAYHLGYGGSRSAVAYRKAWIIMLNQQPYTTDLDKIKVNNNDEILVYQVPDNTVPWSVTHLTTGTDSLKLNQQVDLQLMSYSCSMDQSRSVSVNSSQVQANRSVQVELQSSARSSSTYTTDEFGEVSVTMDQVGEYLLVSGMDVSRLFVESITGTTQMPSNKLLCKVFPNPFSAHLRIEGPASSGLVQIADLQGRIVYSEPYSQPVIDLHDLPRGFYFLKIQSGSQVFQQKLIKQ